MKATLILAICLLSLAATSAFAGEYSDALGKCFVNSTTKEDRASLIRWFYAAASRHPAVQGLATVSDAQIDEANRAVATLFVNLLTTSCKAEAQKAYQEEGPPMFRLSFDVLDKVAAQELFDSPEVKSTLRGLQKYVDHDKLEVLKVAK
ncbi:MAG TPA: hypothetical protein VGI93_23255 [Steroidobacteraceae bacterium]|jgi:hypothetical protein